MSPDLNDIILKKQISFYDYNEIEIELFSVSTMYV